MPFHALSHASGDEQNLHEHEKTILQASFPDHTYDLLCFCADHTGQTTQQLIELLTPCSSPHRIYIFEEQEVYGEEEYYELLPLDSHAWLVRFVFVHSVPLGEMVWRQQRLLELFMHTAGVERYLTWYQNPGALAYSDHLEPLAVIYDLRAAVERDCINSLMGETLAQSADAILITPNTELHIEQVHHLIPCVPLNGSIEPPAIPFYGLLDESSFQVASQDVIRSEVLHLLDYFIAERWDWPCYSTSHVWRELDEYL